MNKAPFFHFLGYDNEKCVAKENFIKKLEELGYKKSRWSCSNLKDCVGVAIHVWGDEKTYTLCDDYMDSKNPKISWSYYRERFSAADTFFDYLKRYEEIMCK